MPQSIVLGLDDDTVLQLEPSDFRTTLERSEVFEVVAVASCRRLLERLFLTTELPGWTVGVSAKTGHRATFAHFRDRSGIEVDIVVERPDGRVIAIEVKSARSVNQRDASSPTFLRERLGERFDCGILFHGSDHRTLQRPGLGGPSPCVAGRSLRSQESTGGLGPGVHRHERAFG